MPSKIHFFSEGIHYKLSHPRKITTWIKGCITNETKVAGAINFIFCNDSYLHKINLEYLNHDTLTDIITFDNSDGSIIEGDIYISVDRVRENSMKYNVDFEDELQRVMIHGILHLIGYSDKTSALKKQMRKKEDAYLSLR